MLRWSLQYRAGEDCRRWGDATLAGAGGRQAWSCTAIDDHPRHLRLGCRMQSRFFEPPTDYPPFRTDGRPQNGNALDICHDPAEAPLKKILLAGAGVGALVAIAAGFVGVPTLIGIGAVVMLISLILLPWVNEGESAPPADRADHGR